MNRGILALIGSYRAPCNDSAGKQDTLSCIREKSKVSKLDIRESRHSRP